MIAPGGDSEQTLNQSISLQASDDVHSGMIGHPAAEDVRTGHRPNRNCCFPTGGSGRKSWHKCWPRNSRKRFSCYNRRPSKRSKTVGDSEGSGMGSNEDVFYEDNEGCYTIGKGESSYELRYFIDLRTQSKHLDEEVMFDECLPCCNSRAERSIGGWVWSFIRSEAFLYSLHMTAILLGGLKEGMDLRKDEDDADIHLEASIIETIATLMLILIRTVNAYRNYQVFKRSILSIRYKGMDKNIHLRSIRIWLYLYVASSIVLAIICISCFFIFLYFAHLGWTVLSNQFCLISIMVFSSLYVTRVTLAVFRVREDQHKAVLCEAVLMLRELGLEKCACGSNTSSDRVAARESVKKFVAALNSMELFEKPRHIDLHRSYREQYQRISEMETSFTNSSNY